MIRYWLSMVEPVLPAMALDSQLIYLILSC